MEKMYCVLIHQYAQLDHAAGEINAERKLIALLKDRVITVTSVALDLFSCVETEWVHMPIPTVRLDVVQRDVAFCFHMFDIFFLVTLLALELACDISHTDT